MSSIGEVMSRFGDLYSAGSYQDALALVTIELPNHPSDNVLLLCFSAAMSARIGDTAGALSTFRTALDKGYWYHEGALRNDPDFASLQDETEFNAIVEQSTQRRQAALSGAKPMIHVLEPADQTQPAPLLIALHGNLSNIDEYAAYWQTAVEKGWRVALPQSSRMSWLSGRYDWPDVEAGLNELDQHYQMLVTQYPVDPARLVIAGFSSGGLVAERAVITQRLPVRGLLWIEGVPDPDIQIMLADHPPFDFRAYFAAGQSQDFLQTAETLSQALAAVGVACQLETINSPYHEMPASFAQTLDRVLAWFTEG